MIEEAYRRGEVEVHGMFYDVSNAVVLRVTPTSVDSLELASGGV